MTIGLCVLAGALVLKTVFLRERLTRPRGVRRFFLAAALIPLCKSSWSIFLPLVLLVPAALLPGGRAGKAAGGVVLGGRGRGLHRLVEQGGSAVAELRRWGSCGPGSSGARSSPSARWDSSWIIP